MDPSERRTAKKLQDTRSWKSDDFGHGWHFRKGRLGAVGRRGKDHTDRMRRLHDRAIVRSEIDAVEADMAADREEVEKAYRKDCELDAMYEDNLQFRADFKLDEETGHVGDYDGDWDPEWDFY